MTMKNGTISNNIANDGVDGNSDGGGIAIVKIYDNPPTVTLEGGTISGNKADDGGGIINGDSSAGADASTLKISGVTISENKATVGSGGGIYSGAKLTMESGEITNNIANTYGGGMIIKTNAIISGGKISYNRAKLYNGGGIQLDGILKLRGGSLIGNKAPEGIGGGISTGRNFNTVRLTIDTPAKIGNNSADYGGGVACFSQCTINYATIYSNTATMYGGGVYIKNDDGMVRFRLNGGVIKNNNAKSGGGIYLVKNLGSYDVSGSPKCTDNNQFGLTEDCVWHSND